MMNNKRFGLDNIEFEQPLEEEIEKIDISETKRKVYTDQGDPEVESLYGKYKRGRLIVQPDFQRHFVWDSDKSSRLIESALLDIPLPVIYLSEEKDGQEYIIDGQQRLTAFFSFMDGKFPDGRDFRLNGLKVITELNRKSFKEISDELQDKIRYCKIRTITFRKESQSDLKFEIFERLNTGAVSLNDQELRNCIYRGRYNELLRDLSSNSDFMYLLGLKSPDKRMKDVELVLRFAAFLHTGYLNYKSPMRKFLNGDMEKYQNITEQETTEFKNAFKNAVSLTKSLLGKHAFKRFYKGNDRKPNGYWEPTKFNTSLFDIVMGLFAKEDKNKVYQNLDSIREALIDLMINDEEFIRSIEISTSHPQGVTTRFDKWRLALQEIIGIGQKEPRCFSHKLKEELYRNDAACSICAQKIQDMDDAAIDHIEQYWKGGRTIPGNARLTHRYCNAARSRHDNPVEGKQSGNEAISQVISPVSDLCKSIPHGLEARESCRSDNNHRYDSSEKRLSRQKGMIIRIENKIINASSVSDMYYQILQFLVDSGTIEKLKLHLPYATSSVRYLLARNKIHPNGNEFTIPVEYRGYYMEAHKDYHNAFNHVKDMLSADGIFVECVEQ